MFFRFFIGVVDKEISTVNKSHNFATSDKTNQTQVLLIQSIRLSKDFKNDFLSLPFLSKFPMSVMLKYTDKYPNHI